MIFFFACPSCNHEFEVEAVGKDFQPSHCPRCDAPLDELDLFEARKDAEAEKAPLCQIERALPTSFYADRPITERVQLLVEHWQRGVEIAKAYDELARKVATMRDALLTNQFATWSPESRRKALDELLSEGYPVVWVYDYAKAVVETQKAKEVKP